MVIYTDIIEPTNFIEISTTHHRMDIYSQKGIVSRYIVAEKITGLFAQPLIDQSGIATSFQKPLVVLDNACGTGIVSSFLNRTLHYKARKRWKLVCSDLTQEILDYTKQRIRGEGWLNAKPKLADAQDTGLPNEYFTHVFVGFGEYGPSIDLQYSDRRSALMPVPSRTAFNTFLDETAAMKGKTGVYYPERRSTDKSTRVFSHPQARGHTRYFHMAVKYAPSTVINPTTQVR